MFGDTPTWAVILDLMLFLNALIISCLLTPLLWRIFGKMSNLCERVTDTSDSILQLCESVKEITIGLTEGRVRDIELKAEIESMQRDLREHIREEREQKK